MKGCKKQERSITISVSSAQGFSGASLMDRGSVQITLETTIIIDSKTLQKIMKKQLSIKTLNKIIENRL